MNGISVLSVLLCVAATFASAPCGGIRGDISIYREQPVLPTIISGIAPRISNYRLANEISSVADSVPLSRSYAGVYANSAPAVVSTVPSTIAVESTVSSVSAPASGVVVSSAPIATNIVAPAVNANVPTVTRTNSARRFRVALDNCGPKSRKLAPISARPVATAPVVAPTVTLPYSVPRTRTVSNSCRCVKIIAKPQPIEQVITVPVQRNYIQTLFRPKYEIINYGADPVNCPVQEEYAYPCAY